MKRNNTLCRIFALSLCFVFIFLLGCNQPPQENDQPPEPPVMELEYKAFDTESRPSLLEDLYYTDWKKIAMDPPAIESIDWNGRTVQLKYIYRYQQSSPDELGARYNFVDVEEKIGAFMFDEEGRLLHFTEASDLRWPSGDAQISEQEAIEEATSVLSRYVDASEYTVSCSFNGWYVIEFSKNIGDYATLEYATIMVSRKGGRILKYSSHNLGRVPKNLDTSKIDSERSWAEVKKVLDEIYSKEYSEEEFKKIKYEIESITIVPLSGDSFGLHYNVNIMEPTYWGTYQKDHDRTILVK